jgi:DNA-binding winged helix-turn-helix (wHTH) protein
MDAGMRDDPRYEFGPFVLDASEHQLRRGRQVVPLSPKVFDTLLVLVANGGHVMSKDELISAVWPDAFVEDSSLSQNISLLRKALGENFIETVPKRGYRFVAPVSTGAVAAEEVIFRERSATKVVVVDIEPPGGC